MLPELRDNLDLYNLLRNCAVIRPSVSSRVREKFAVGNCERYENTSRGKSLNFFPDITYCLSGMLPGSVAEALVLVERMQSSLLCLSGPSR